MSLRSRRVVFLLEALMYVRLRDGAARCSYTGQRLGQVTEQALNRLRLRAKEPDA